MNNVFFKNGFLTSTEAQNICNVANEVIAGLTDSLNTVQFYNTTITLVRTYSEPEIPKLWKKQNVYIRKITLEEYNNHSLDVAA